MRSIVFFGFLLLFQQIFALSDGSAVFSDKTQRKWIRKSIITASPIHISHRNIKIEKNSLHGAHYKTIYRVTDSDIDYIS